MKVGEFNSIYKQAEKTIITQDEFFLYEGWFWLGLSEKQHMKMYRLLINQGANEVTIKDKKYILLKSGIKLKRIEG